jgi:hypothetical protein
MITHESAARQKGGRGGVSCRVPRQRGEGPKQFSLDTKETKKNENLSCILRGCIGRAFEDALGTHLGRVWGVLEGAFEDAFGTHLRAR